MNAIKAASKLLDHSPRSEEAQTLARLVLALENNELFELGRLYTLRYEAFDLALSILEEWRSGQSPRGMAKLFDLSRQVRRASLS
jgi:hypothetical protein